MARRLFGLELDEAEGVIKKGTIVTNEASRKLQWVYEMLPPDTYSAGRKQPAARANARKAQQRRTRASRKRDGAPDGAEDD